MNKYSYFLHVMNEKNKFVKVKSIAQCHPYNKGQTLQLNPSTLFFFFKSSSLCLLTDLIVIRT